MESKDELKEIDIKNCTCYYFDDIIMNRDIYSIDVLLDKKIMKILQFMTFHTKLQRAQNHSALGSMNQMDLLGFMVVNLDIYYCLIMDYLIKFVIGLNSL